MPHSRHYVELRELDLRVEQYSNRQKAEIADLSQDQDLTMRCLRLQFFNRHYNQVHAPNPWSSRREHHDDQRWSRTRACICWHPSTYSVWFLTSTSADGNVLHSCRAAVTLPCCLPGLSTSVARSSTTTRALAMQHPQVQAQQGQAIPSASILCHIISNSNNSSSPRSLLTAIGLQQCRQCSCV